MARLNKMPRDRVKVSWYDVVHHMSRSVICEDEDEANEFKALVEAGESGDTHPSMWVLREHGLMHLANKLTPVVVYLIERIVNDPTGGSADERLAALREYLARF